MDSESDVDSEPVVPEHVRRGPSGYFTPGKVWRVGCSCGWGMELDEPPNTKKDAEQDWRYHLAEVVPPRAAEEFFASTRPGFERRSGVEVEAWYKGAIRSRAKWRQDYPKWLCKHQHESEAHALACAEEELPLRLKEWKEGYQPKLGEEFEASAMSSAWTFPSSNRQGEQEWFRGTITSQDEPQGYHIVRWSCDHRHESRADAVACAEEQLKDERWHPT